MKWGQNIFGKVKAHEQKMRRRRLDKETEKIVKDSKTVNTKAAPGKIALVRGKYMQKNGRYAQIVSHIVDDHGNVKLSYIRGKEGDHFVAAGKEQIAKMNLNQYFNSLNGTWDYDVYK